MSSYPGPASTVFAGQVSQRVELAWIDVAKRQFDLYYAVTFLLLRFDVGIEPLYSEVSPLTVV